MSDARRRLERYVARALRRARLRRLVAVAAIVLSAATAGLVTVTLITGAPPWHPGGRPAPVTVVLLAAAGASIALGALLPQRRRRVVREVDRRLGLAGALVTADEESASADPICRLLVSRTARAIGTRPRKDALPLRAGRAALVLPLLAGLAAVLAHGPRSAPPDSAVETPAGASAVSESLKDAAEEIIARSRPADVEAIDAARELARIDAALRRGDLAPERARALVDALAARHDSAGPRPLGDADAALGIDRGEPGSGGPDPGGDWRRVLGETARRVARTVTTGPSAAARPVAGAGSRARESGASSGRGDGAGGRGGGRGTGRAALRLDGTPPRAPSADAPPAGGAWTLPAPARPGEDVAPGAGAPPLTVSRGDAAATARLVASWRRPLTNAERELVNAYIEALSTGERSAPRASRPGAPSPTRTPETREP